MATAPRQQDSAAMRPANDSQIKLVTQLDARVQSLDDIRYSWWLHWRELAEYLLARAPAAVYAKAAILARRIRLPMPASGLRQREWPGNDAHGL